MAWTAVMAVDAFGVETSAVLVGPLNTSTRAAATAAVVPAPMPTNIIGRDIRLQRMAGAGYSAAGSADHA